jgi:hypothetical protein
MAKIIQKPYEKNKTAIVLYSLEEGVGKNIIFDIFSELLNGYHTSFKDTDSIKDRFNSNMMGKLFVIGDEINGRATEIMNELKDIITREKENVEFKGKDKIFINDFKNYAFTTNNENVFKISNTDRRFALNECPSEIKNYGYYSTLFNILKDEKILTNIFNFFKCRDISNFIPKNIPLTEYRKTIILNNIPAYIKFIIDEDNTALHNGEEYETSQLYKFSIDYAKRNKMISTYSERFFIVNFKKIFGKFNHLNSKTRRSIYIFPKNCIDDLKNEISNNYIKKNNEII